MSVSDNMVMEVVSAAVSGRDMAGNWIRIVYTESDPSPLQSVSTICRLKYLARNDSASLTFYLVEEIICAPALMTPVSVIPFPVC